MKILLPVLGLTLIPAILFAKTQTHHGEIKGAKYLILVPETWNQKVILLAHGFRPEEQALSASFDTGSDFTQSLLKDGWAISSTSFRRNGWIIDDALIDLQHLQTKTKELVGQPEMTLLVGNSMGGQIATRAAEGTLPFLDGAIAIGAALQDYPSRELSPQLTFQPRIPLIFLCNNGESNHSKTYREKSEDKRVALRTIERPGHCNVSDLEKLNALEALQEAVNGEPLPAEVNATRPAPLRESTAQIKENALIGLVTNASGSWGNLTTSFVASDLKDFQIGLKETFVIKSETAELTLTLAEHYRQIPQHQGAAYLTPNGYLRVQINGSSAARHLGVQKGSRLTLHKPSIPGE